MIATEKKNAKDYDFRLLGEVYTFWTSSFDVDMAKKLVLERNLPVANIQLDELASFAKRPKEKTSHNIMHQFDWEKIDSDVVDLDFPLILINHPKAGIMVIDGWHRIAKATNNGIMELPGFCLTDRKDVKKVMLS